jgi:O-antigen ligase
MTNTKLVLTPFWLVFSSCTLAIGWLLPNHYYPWVSFHSDAWIALALLLAAAAFLRMRGPQPLHRITVLVALLICVPWLQYAFGLIQQPGEAWISCTYLFGLFLALLVGARWESNSPGQVGDGLFLAIGIASMLSVGLQLQQWFQLNGLELWTMGGGPDRPHANFGQPNQLGTFLLWGVLAAAWGYGRKHLGGWSATLLAAYLLFGAALTGSRTAWVGVALLIGAVWWWRPLWANSRWPWVATGMGLYFVLCVVGAAWLRQTLLEQSPMDVDHLFRHSGEIRPLAWSIFLDAAWQQPWFGYGWNQSALAQMAVASEHPPLHVVFTYGHNLFLDLVLWCGIPLGLLISFSLVWWFFKRFGAVQSAENAVLMLVLLVVANHAMFELPLYYAYFLIPTGLVMGALHTRLGVQPILLMGRRASLALWFAAATLLALIIRDYTRVEPSYQTLRLEWSRIKMTLPVGPPDVLLLTQWHDYIKFARIEPKAGLSAEELGWMRNVTGLYPNPILLHKLAITLGLNQRPDEARLWLKTLCKVAPDSECLIAEKLWARQSLKYPEIAAIPWPVKTLD